MASWFTVLGAVLASFVVILASALIRNISARNRKGYHVRRKVGLGEAALDYIARSTGVNNITLVMTLDRDMDPVLFSRALRRVQKKYDLFRTHIVHARKAHFEVLPYTQDLPPIHVAQIREADWRQVWDAEINTPFGYGPDSNIVYPLVRTLLISSPTNTPSECVLLFTVDHRIADGFTAGVIFDELIKDYGRLKQLDLKGALPSLANEEPEVVVPLNPASEELGPWWLMLPQFFLKFIAFAIYCAVFAWWFRGFTRLPLRMSGSMPLETPRPQQPPVFESTVQRGSQEVLKAQQLSSPRPPEVVRGMSSISGLFGYNTHEIGTLRVPFTTAAEFASLTEEQSQALLATCKREKVTITSALFAATALAIAEKEVKETQIKLPQMVHSYTLLDLRKFGRAFTDPIRLGLHISSINSIADVTGPMDEQLFWKLCRKYQTDKAKSFLLLEPWRNLLLQWLEAHAAVFISMCNFYRGPGSKFVRWLGKNLPSVSPTFAISNMGSLDHFTWTDIGARNGTAPEGAPIVKEVYGGATIPVSWPLCLLLTNSVSNTLKLNFVFSPQALPRSAIQSLSQRVTEILGMMAATHKTPSSPPSETLPTPANMTLPIPASKTPPTAANKTPPTAANKTPPTAANKTPPTAANKTPPTAAKTAPPVPAIAPTLPDSGALTG